VACVVRLLLPVKQRAQTLQRLGAYDPIRHEVVTLTNDTVVNPGDALRITG